MKGVNAVTADRSAGCGRACQVEEDAGICPFLEPRKTRHEYGNGPKHFPKSQDGKELHWVAKDGHYAMDVALKLCHLRDTAASNSTGYEYGSSPISNGFCFQGQSNPPTTRSKLPMNFCHPPLAPW